MSQNSLNPDFRQELHQTSSGERIVYYPEWDTTIRFFGSESVGENVNPGAWPTTVLGLSWPFTSAAEINSSVIGGFSGITAQAILSSAKPVQSSIDKSDWLLIETINRNLPVPETAYQDWPLFSSSRFLLKFTLPEYDTLFPESAFLNLFVYDQYNWPAGGIVAEVFLADPEADHTATWNKESTVTGQGWTAGTLLPNAFTGDWGGHGASASSGGGSIVLLGDEPPVPTRSDGVEFTIPKFDDLSVPQKLKIDVTYLVQYAISSGMSGDISFLVRARFWPTVPSDYFTQPSDSGPVVPTDPNTQPTDDDPTRPGVTTTTMQYLWWHDFRAVFSESPFLKALCEHPAAYAPILTVSGKPSNKWTNAYDWNGPNATTILPDNPFPDTAAGCGQSFANAYLHTMKFKFNNRFDGSIPFCCYPNGWGNSLADNRDRPPNSVDWITNRDTHFVRLGRNDADLLTSNFEGVAVDARARGYSGYAVNGIADCYAWWVEFFTAAKTFIDTAVGHDRTPVEIYDDLEGQGPDLNYILRPIATGSTIRVFDLIRADKRWNAERINGFQTWAEFFDTLTDTEKNQLLSPANVSVFTDALTTVAEKLGVFRNTCIAWQIDQSLVKAARDIFGSRFRFACEYRIKPETSARGTINDRTVRAFEDRIFENRGPLILPNGWGSSPVAYQSYGFRNDSITGDLNKMARALGYTRTGNTAYTFGPEGGAFADGRLFNIARMKENIRRVRSLGGECVPWWTYKKYYGPTSGIVFAQNMTSSDHLDVLRYWFDLGVNRMIIWGNPSAGYNNNPNNGPIVQYYESDFKTTIDEILPNLPSRTTGGPVR